MPSPQYSPDHSNIGATHAAAGLQWLFDRYPLWGLSMRELATLLGGISERQLYRWKRHVQEHDEINIPSDALERISLLLGIHKALTLITPDGHEREAYKLFKRPMDLIGLRGLSIRELLIEDSSTDKMYDVRRSLEGLRASP